MLRNTRGLRRSHPNAPRGGVKILKISVAARIATIVTIIAAGVFGVTSASAATVLPTPSASVTASGGSCEVPAVTVTVTDTTPLGSIDGQPVRFIMGYWLKNTQTNETEQFVELFGTDPRTFTMSSSPLADGETRSLAVSAQVEATSGNPEVVTVWSGSVSRSCDHTPPPTTQPPVTTTTPPAPPSSTTVPPTTNPTTSTSSPPATTTTQPPVTTTTTRTTPVVNVTPGVGAPDTGGSGDDGLSLASRIGLSGLIAAASGGTLFWIRRRNA